MKEEVPPKPEKDKKVTPDMTDASVASIEIMCQDAVMHNIFTQAVSNFFYEEVRNYLGLEFDGGVLFSDSTEEE